MMMHISMWSDSYYPYVSGVTRSIATSREALKALGHRVSLFCPSYPGTRPEEDIYRLPSFKAPTNPGYYVAIPLRPGLFSTLRAQSPEVIHIHSPFNLGKLGLRFGKRLDVPVVFTYHTMYGMYSHYVPILGRSASRLVELATFKTANQADVLITPSSAIRDYLRENGVKSEVFVIPNGIDVPEFQNGDRGFLRRAFGIPEGVPVVLTCGRLGKEKNLDTLLRSFSIVSQKVDSVLLLVGDGPERESLKALSVTLGISERVIFAGTVSPGRMPDIYAGADLFLFTSLTDTQGLVIVEAKAAGLPAVAVAALGVKDMVEDQVDGFLCRNEPEEIAERVIFLLENPSLLRKMKENAKKAALRFSKEETARKLLECYKSVQ
ncbi:MAG: glycosyltransferase family 4 protein [Candidatus Fermentithermobacillus carboniphilus]|uniref:Glycosyltransferase family 4 protein n=1 Tax=Candidatus Fermentithermobacillus carboniphilus TaxID=3085328 RepID=A0AAT9LBD6_9FIRM|nr:MAG: glycosyltransferase family 4 protein [Candidatus Fermentithermobacillus carboniphilus]